MNREFLNTNKIPKVLNREFLNTARILRVEHHQSIAKVSYIETTYEDGKVGIKPKIAEVKLNKLKSSLNLTNENLENFTKFGVNGEEHSNSILLIEIESTKTKLLFDNYFKLGKENFESKYTRLQKLVKRIFKNYELIYYLNGNKLDTLVINRKLVSKILNLSNSIAITSKMGAGNFLVTTGQIASILQDDPAFTFTPNNKIIINNGSEIYQVGKIGNIKVFVNPYLNFDDNTVVIGNLTGQFDFNGTFLLEEIIPLIKTTKTDSGKNFQAETLYTIFNSPDAKYRYETVKFSLKKRPTWKKILNL